MQISTTLQSKAEWQAPTLFSLDDFRATLVDAKGSGNPFEIHCTDTTGLTIYYPTTSGSAQSGPCRSD